jgi:hypothetical protein
MAEASEWASRVAAWRSSGETSEEFCKGRDFTPGGLRHWAHRLGKTRPYNKRRTPARAEAGEIRLARVERVRIAAATHAPEESGDASLTIELGAARVVVRSGFDHATLAAVLDVLDARRGAR